MPVLAGWTFTTEVRVSLPLAIHEVNGALYVGVDDEGYFVEISTYNVPCDEACATIKLIGHLVDHPELVMDIGTFNATQLHTALCDWNRIVRTEDRATRPPLPTGIS